MSEFEIINPLKFIPSKSVNHENCLCLYPLKVIYEHNTSSYTVLLFHLKRFARLAIYFFFYFVLCNAIALTLHFYKVVLCIMFMIMKKRQELKSGVSTICMVQMLKSGIQMMKAIIWRVTALRFVVNIAMVIYVTIHGNTNHIAHKIVLEIRWPLPRMAFGVLLESL